MNATTIGTSSVLPHEGGFATSTSNPLHLLLAVLSRYRPELELLWVLLSWSPFLARSYSYASPKVTRVSAYPYPSMLAHIFVAPLYVLRWHARYAALRVWPKPELLDLVLFSAFWLTSASLEWARNRVGPRYPVGRAGFQVAIMMHGVFFAAAWWGGRDPALFRATVKFFNWFASFRGARLLLARVDPKLMANYHASSSMIATTSACFALWEAGVPNAIPVFLVSVVALATAKQALAKRMAK